LYANFCNLVLVLAAIVISGFAAGQTPAARQRIGRDKLIQLILNIRNQTGNDKARYEQLVIQTIREMRLDFPIPPETEQEIRRDGASAAVVSAAMECQLTALDLFPPQSAAAKIAKDTLLRAIASVKAQKTASERSVLEQQLVAYLQTRRVDFLVAPDTEGELSRAGASARLIAAVKEIQLNAGEVLQAAQMDFQAGRFTQAVQEAEAAAAMQPSLQAFQLIAGAKANTGDVAGSQAASLQALAAGGEITIPVLLAPSGENFRKTCEATLVIGRKRASLVSSTLTPDCRASEIQTATLVEAGPNEYVGKDRQAFHVLVQSPQGTLVNLCLAPVSGGNKWALDVLAAAKP
jgi:hypothetical protein